MPTAILHCDMASDRREHALDGLRGLAALAVLGFHTWLYRDNRPHGPRRRPAQQRLRELNVGLICFFVLSGYLLYRPYARAARTGERPVDVRGYGLRRVARIVPAYYAVIAGALILYAIVGYHAITPGAGGLRLFAVFGQNYSMDTVMHIDPVTWTLCIEAAFYVFLPFVGLVVWRLGPRRTGWHAAVLVALVAVTVVWNTLAFEYHWNATLPSRCRRGSASSRSGCSSRTGSSDASRPRSPRARMRASVTALIAAAGARRAGVRLLDSSRWLQGDVSRAVTIYLVFAVGFALIIAALAAGRGPVVRALGARPLAWLGLISYGVFLWHLPLILTLKQIGALPEPLGPRLAVVLALALAAGALSWRFIERPAIGWASRRARRSGEASRRAGGDRRAGGAPAARDGPGDAVTAAEVVGATLARSASTSCSACSAAATSSRRTRSSPAARRFHAARHEGGATSHGRRLGAGHRPRRRRQRAPGAGADEHDDRRWPRRPRAARRCSCWPATRPLRRGAPTSASTSTGSSSRSARSPTACTRRPPPRPTRRERCPRAARAPPGRADAADRPPGPAGDAGRAVAPPQPPAAPGAGARRGRAAARAARRRASAR